jgi:hypothetical protein
MPVPRHAPSPYPLPRRGRGEHGQPSHKGKGDTQPFVCRISSDQGLTELTTAKARLLYPFAKLDPKPSAGDPIVKAWVDKELASEALSYVLASGREGTVHLEQVLEYNKDPDYLRDRLLYSLTLEAQKRVAASPLPRREIIRRLGTSVTQF